MKVLSSLFFINVILIVFFHGVESCSPSGNGKSSIKYGDSHKADYSHLDHLDAGKYPTLSSKIRHVLQEHYKTSGHHHLGWYKQPQVEIPSHYGAQHEGLQELGLGGGHYGQGDTQHHGLSHGWGGENTGYEFGAQSAHGEGKLQEHPAEYLEKALGGNGEPPRGFRFSGF